jgi:hypothetical protein
MSNSAAAAADHTHVGKATRRVPRSRPPGVPGWAWLFGMAVVPLEQHDEDAPQRWVVSAGAGTTHVTAVLHDGPYAIKRLTPTALGRGSRP